MEADCFHAELLLGERACRLAQMGSLCRIDGGSGCSTCQGQRSGSHVLGQEFAELQVSQAAAQVQECLLSGKNICCCHLSTKHRSLGARQVNSCRMNSCWAEPRCSLVKSVSCTTGGFMSGHVPTRQNVMCLAYSCAHDVACVPAAHAYSSGSLGILQ